MDDAGLTNYPLPPASLLSDEIVELRLIRMMGLHNIHEREENFHWMGHVPEYRFAIYRKSDALRVGRIHIRNTSDESISKIVGHIGYAVDEAHQRNGYATHAIRLIVGIAGHFNINPLWVLIVPDNLRSRRAAERAGFVLSDIIDSTPQMIAVGIVPNVCRYCVATM